MRRALRAGVLVVILLATSATVIARPPTGGAGVPEGILGQGDAGVRPAVIGLPLGVEPELPPIQNFFRLQKYRASANAWGLVQWTLLGLAGADQRAARVRAPTRLEDPGAFAFFKAIENLSLGALYEQVNSGRTIANPAVQPKDLPADLVSIGRKLQRATLVAGDSAGRAGALAPPVLTLSNRLEQGEAPRGLGDEASGIPQASRRRYLALLRFRSRGQGARVLLEVYDPHQPVDSVHRVALLVADPDEGDLALEADWAKEADPPGPEFSDPGLGELEATVPGRGKVRFVRVRPDQLGMASGAPRWGDLAMAASGGNQEALLEVLRKERALEQARSVQARKKMMADSEYYFPRVARDIYATWVDQGPSGLLWKNADELADVRARVPLHEVIDPSNIESSPPTVGTFDTVDGSLTR